MRVGELASLTLNQLQCRQARIMGKGGKCRKIFWSAMTQDLLSSWLSIRNAPHDVVLASINDNAPLTEWGIRNVLKRMKQRLGITGAMNPHSFRHAFIKHYISSGGDLVTLAKITGHSDITYMIEVYGQFADDETANIYQTHSPLKRIFDTF
jgi:site-specific recombinase XerD